MGVGPFFEAHWQQFKETIRSGTNRTKAAPSTSTAIAGFQGVLLVLTPMATAITTTAFVAGQSDSYLTWAAFATLLICGFRLRRTRALCYFRRLSLPQPQLISAIRPPIDLRL